MSSPECSEPLCSPFSALTTQCTDQCVVIACNDPNHAESPVCDKQGSNSQCDDNMDCTDCDGFEDFVSSGRVQLLMLIDHVASVL
jgi:hypothetical protein